MNDIPTSPFGSQLTVPCNDLFIKSTNERSYMIVGDMRDYMIFGALRDDLLRRDVFECEG